MPAKSRVWWGVIISLFLIGESQATIINVPNDQPTNQANDDSLASNDTARIDEEGPTDDDMIYIQQARHNQNVLAYDGLGESFEQKIVDKSMQKPEPQFVFVTEAGVMHRFFGKYHSPLRPDMEDASKFAFTAEVGLMRRIGRKYYIGATGYGNGCKYLSTYGVRMKWRYKLSRRTYLYVSPGLILGEEGHYSGTSMPAFTGQICLGYKKSLMLKSEMQVIRRYVEHNAETDRWTDVSFHVGAALSGYPGMVGIVLIGLVMLSAAGSSYGI